MRLALLLLLAGCAFEPEGAELWTPPDAYREIWERAAACTGRSGSFERIRWHVVESVDSSGGFPCPDGSCVGRWNAPHDIYIAERWVKSDWVVKHEMIHDLLGKPGHPEEPFLTPCKAMVNTHAEESTP